ncbi:glutathione S-transferase N-terminal domain-containing protein [Candidatus Binatus soli]|jgi:glutathione S-transferase|uniref:glutathione S-transferase N-terminal domain-containing protein n=1 Tax=Candidatus Binatus soli TaxID=1953413 RepID=UPI003D13E722
MPSDRKPRAASYRVYGMTQSYFTRKLTGYLDYKAIPYLMRRFAGANRAAREAGWPGAMPVVKTPDGGFMWDTTAMIHHLESRFPEPRVFPADPVLRFIDYVLEDALDEWFYRPAVGSRWFYEENHRVGGWELARDATHELEVPCDQAYAVVKAHVTATCEPFGVTAANIDSWIGEILRPWLRLTGAHLASHPYFFGARPSLSDFAFFGGNAAHFINDPLCRRWVDADARAIITHTHRIMEPEDQGFGEWMAAGGVPETMIAILAELGRFYLPWVSRAVVDGNAELVFASGQRIEIAATPFLAEARATLLARYAKYRSDALDAVLERAGIRSYFADYVNYAGMLPSYDKPPRPALNRPFGPPWETERRADARKAGNGD